jgi:hypothetical protein
MAAAAFLGAFGIAHAATASLTTGGFSESFDAMGSAGTTPPAGWALYKGDSGSNSTWATSIPASGSLSVASMIPTTSGLTAKTAPTSTNINGYNAAVSPASVSDRILATSPTTVTGSAIQLALVNDTGAAFSNLTLSYDTVRLTSVAASKVEELPGYWVFYSLDGSTWSNLAALNPTQTTVPNTSTGVSSFTAPLALAAPVAAGSTLYVRWVDDNGAPTSPDQIIGLDNVRVAAVPEPESSALFLVGLGVLGAWRLRRQRG